MWKSAIARAKRLKDEGRKFSPVVKKEPTHIRWQANVVAENEGSCSDEDAQTHNDAGGSSNDAAVGVLSPTPATIETGGKRLRSGKADGVKDAQKSAKNASQKLKKMRQHK